MIFLKWILVFNCPFSVGNLTFYPSNTAEEVIAIFIYAMVELTADQLLVSIDLKWHSSSTNVFYKTITSSNFNEYFFARVEVNLDDP